LNFSLHLSIDLNFRHTSKKIEGGSLKKILEKKNVFPKKYVELRTFDGTGDGGGDRVVWKAYTGVIHCVFEQIPKLVQNCFTTPGGFRQTKTFRQVPLQVNF
jgi:hypothetical protein